MFYNTRKYSLEKHTSALRVPYYVKENFNEYYDGNLRRLEANIEEEYVGMLRHNCYRERSQRESLLWRARQYGDKTMMVSQKKFYNIRKKEFTNIWSYRTRPIHSKCNLAMRWTNFTTDPIKPILCGWNLTSRFCWFFKISVLTFFRRLNP